MSISCAIERLLPSDNVPLEAEIVCVPDALKRIPALAPASVRPVVPLAVIFPAKLRFPEESIVFDAEKNCTGPVFIKANWSGRLLVALIWLVALSRVSLPERELSPPTPNVPEMVALPVLVKVPVAVILPMLTRFPEASIL
jgi:hypothetical protein